MRQINKDLAALGEMNQEEIRAIAVEYRVPMELVEMVRANGKLPVPNFAAGGGSNPS